MSLLDPESKTSKQRMRHINIHDLRLECNGFIKAIHDCTTQPSLVELNKFIGQQINITDQISTFHCKMKRHSSAVEKTVYKDKTLGAVFNLENLAKIRCDASSAWKEFARRGAQRDYNRSYNQV